MRLLVTGGGTAGHVYPALTVLDWLRSQSGDSLDVLYLGSSKGMEKQIAQSLGIRYAEIPSAPVRVGNPIAAARGISVLVWGLAAAFQVVGQFRPDAILATGGYVSTPGVLAGWMRRVQSVVYLPDVTPGWAVRAVSRLAKVVATTTECAKKSLPGAKVVTTGYPVRTGFSGRNAEAARLAFGLAPDRFTLTVAGGSRGAVRINDGVLAGIERLLEAGQLIHITGSTDYKRIAELRNALPLDLRERYSVHEYLRSEMPDAVAAADLIVSRAGASILGEYPAAGKASLLIPGPFSGQIDNARFMEKLGASEILANDSAGELSTRVLALAADPERLTRMAGASHRMARPDAAAHIGKLVLNAAGSV